MVEIRLQDYRDISGQFDRLIWIEMIEAVGAQYLGLFLERCSQLLTPEGLMALQAITITDQAYRGSIRRRTDLRLLRMDDIGSHYVRTLRLWGDALRSNWDTARELGYCLEFLRMYEFYFRYCEAGFAERTIGDAQMLLAKPQAG